MGFIADKLAKHSSKSAAYDPASYGVSVSMPKVSTDTTIAKGDSPKESVMPELAEYYATEKRRRERNGVAGTFTTGE